MHSCFIYIFSLNKLSCHNFYCFYYIFFISYWYLHACFSLSHKLSSQHAGSLHLICMQACLSKFTCHQTSKPQKNAIFSREKTQSLKTRNVASSSIISFLYKLDIRGFYYIHATQRVMFWFLRVDLFLNFTFSQLPNSPHFI